MDSVEARAEPSRWRKLAMLLVSTLVGLCVAEGIAGLARGRAYPYLNIFVEDATMGVRLEPNAHTRVRSRTGRVSEVQTNAEGFRDDPWPDPDTLEATAGVDALLLGDSQMFAYGVAAEDGVASQLEHELGPDFEVLNAAVPTWGPTEYTRALEQLVPRYHPRQVIFVANVANDWFESVVPNTARTYARDGWAKRNSRALREAEGEAREFPGRRWLMSRSHLMFLLRSIPAQLRVQSRASVEGKPPAQAARLLLSQLERLTKPREGHRSTVTPHIVRAHELCLQWGCEVVVVGLPMDVQIDAGEWAKYRGEALDLAPTQRLLDDLLADARGLGLRAVDLSAALREASPGAFLGDDYHMSAQGHAAIAEAIAKAMTTSSPIAAGQVGGTPR